jgi:hypothetical protein
VDLGEVDGLRSLSDNGHHPAIVEETVEPVHQLSEAADLLHVRKSP